jgi:hypothetical protein
MNNRVFATVNLKSSVGRTAQPIPIAPRTGNEREAMSADNPRPYHRGQKGRVILFLPGPITEDDLFTDAIAHARRLRRYKAHHKRMQWLEENLGTLVFVAGLFVLAWFVAAK